MIKQRLGEVALFIFIFLVILAGCSGQTTDEKMEACIGRTIWKEMDVSVTDQVSALDVTLKCVDEVGI